MKKNLKNCVDVFDADEAQVLLDMNQFQLIERAGLEPDLRHKKSAHVSAAWHFSRQKRATIRLGGQDLSEYRFLTFSVYATQGSGGSFSLMFDMDSDGNGREGYEVTLSVRSDGWNSYRIELPFMRTVGERPTWSAVGSISFDCVAGGQANRTDTVLYLDNLFVWKHYAPPLYASMPELKGAAAFSRGGGYSIVDRKRILNTPDGSLAVPFEKDGTLWLPMSPVAAGIAHSAVVDNLALTLSFTYRRRKYTFCANRNYMEVGEEREALGFYPLARGGTLFFPADFVRTFFHWRQIYIDPVGLIVLSNRKNIFDPVRDAEAVWRLVADCTFVRPDAQKVLYDLHKQYPNPTRPRLLASHDELMQLRRAAKEDEALGDYVARLKEKYGRGGERFSALPTYDASGNVDVFEAAEAVMAFALLYRVTGEKQYAARTASECEALAGLSDWSLTGASTDVGTLSLAMAIGYDLCRAAWSEAEKALIERAMLRQGVRPILECYDGRGRMWRLGSVTGATVNCGALALALALADVYPQSARRLLSCVLRNTEPCLAAYAPDGGFSESVAAWEKSSRALVLMIMMLRSACGSDYGFSSVPGLAATAYFPIHAETAQGVWNYHNCSEKSVDTSILFALSRISGDPVPAWLRRQQILSGKKTVSFYDILFYTPVDDTLSPNLPLDAVWRKAGLCMMRSHWGDDASFVGLHGGGNREVSGDLDVGTFILEMGGERFFVETGGEESLPPMLRRRAEGQNTIAIDPAEDVNTPDQNPDAEARVTEMRSSPDKAYAVIDTTSISDAILRAKRGMMLTEGRRVAVVQDELTVSHEAVVVWSAWTRAQISLSRGGRVARLTQNGKTLLCRLCGVGGDARFEIREVEGSALSALTVRVTVKERVRMALACRILEDGVSAAERFYEVKPISRWSEVEADT